MVINITLRLKKELKTKEAIFGTKIAFKKKDIIEKIYVAEDCPEEIKKRINTLAKKQKIDLIFLEFSKEELKDICKKPFNISILSILGKQKPKREEEKKEEETKEKEKEEKKKPEKNKKPKTRKTKKKKSKKRKKRKKIRRKKKRRKKRKNKMPKLKLTKLLEKLDFYDHEGGPVKDYSQIINRIKKYKNQRKSFVLCIIPTGEEYKYNIYLKK